jgi:pimeloyl-ACP methyl ester carboxylesterase
MPQHLPKVIRLAIKYYSTQLRMMAAISNKWGAKKAIDIFIKPHPAPKLKNPPIFDKANKLHLVSGGFNMAGFEWLSEVPNPKTCLIAHGFAGNCRKFNVYVQPLLDKGYNVIMYDAPAHGESEGKYLFALSYSVAIKDMIAKHGAFDAYIGHSLGGLSIMLALEKPTSPPTSPEGVKEQPKIVLLAPATESTTAADIFFSFLKLDTEVRKHFNKLVVERSGYPLEWFSISRMLPHSKAPILWVHDHDDPTTPMKDVQPVLASHPKNVEFYLTTGLGHSKIYRNKKVVEKVVGFLSNH